MSEQYQNIKNRILNTHCNEDELIELECKHLGLRRKNKIQLVLWCCECNCWRAVRPRIEIWGSVNE